MFFRASVLATALTVAALLSLKSAKAQSLPSADKAEISIEAKAGIYSKFFAPNGAAVLYSGPDIFSEVYLLRKTDKNEMFIGFANSQGLHKCWSCTPAEERDLVAALKLLFSKKRSVEFRYTHLFLNEKEGSNVANFTVTYSREHELSPTLKAIVSGEFDGYMPTTSKGEAGTYIVSIAVQVEKNVGNFKFNSYSKFGYDRYGIFGNESGRVVYRQDFGLTYGRGEFEIGPVATFVGANDNQRPGTLALGLRLRFRRVLRKP